MNRYRGRDCGSPSGLQARRVQGTPAREPDRNARRFCLDTKFHEWVTIHETWYQIVFQAGLP